MYAPFLFSTSEKELHYVLLHRKNAEAYPVHWHDEIEIVYVCDGTLKTFINGESLSIETGDAAIICPGDRHYCLPSDADVIAVIFSPDIMKGVDGSTSVEDEARRLLSQGSRTTESWSVEDKEKLGAILSELESLPEGSLTSSILIRSKLFGLLALAAADRPGEPYMEMHSVPSRVDDRIGRVFRFIDEHYMEGISMPDAAAAAGYVPTYFSRVFKSSTGMTFYDYLTMYRIRRAELLLANTSDSVSSIAAASGFSSVKTFDRVFKEHEGISPLKFRKLHLSQI